MKRSPLNRDPNYMPRDPAKQMKRTRLRPVSPRKAARRDDARRLFEDGFGVRFHETRMWLPDLVKDWPTVRIVDRKANRDFVRLGGMCYWCERLFHPNELDPHHIFGASHRCDCLTNLMPVCRACHDKIQSVPELLPSVLYRKWTLDRQHVSWVRLTLLAGRWLDDLVLVGPSIP